MAKNKKRKEDELRSGRKSGNTAQQAVPFLEWYENGLFRVTETRYCIVCSFTNAGYLSKTDTEQMRKYESYRTALASLPTYIHYEEIVSNRPVDLQTYLDAVAENLQPGHDRYADAFFAVQGKLLQTVDRELALKRYLLVLSTEAVGNENPYGKLTDALNVLKTRFREMDSVLSLLSPEEVFAELYIWFAPFGSRVHLRDGRLEIPADLYRRGLNIKDLIAPDGIRYMPDRILLGNAFCRVFTITDYGKEMIDTLCYLLLNHDLPVAVSKHIDRIDKERALKNINNQLNELESRRQTRLAKNHTQGTNYVSGDLQRAIEGCNQVLQELTGNEEFLRQTVYVTVFASTPEELDEFEARVRCAALSAHCMLRTARFLQADAFRGALPMGQAGIERMQNLLSGEAAVMTPFSYESQFDPSGFLYGKNQHSGEPIIINRKLGAQHGFVFGRSGSGKSFYVKNEISNILFQPFTAKDDVIVVDASDEYIPLALATGGKVIHLEAASDTHLNPLHISDAQRRTLGARRAEANKIEHLIALLSQIKARDGLSAVEKNLVDAAAARTLRRDKHPTLNTFYAALEIEANEQPTMRANADELRNWLKRYVEGSVTLFSGEDNERNNADAHARFTVYSVHHLTGDLRDAAMLAMLERIEARVLENYELGRWTWIYIDEMHRYFDVERNPYAAGRFARFYAEMRKYGAILTGITQLPLPVVNSKDGAAMLSNSRFVVMAELDSSNIEAVTQLYELNEDQQRALASPLLGQYVIRTNSAPVNISLLYPGARREDANLMYDLFNTTFDDTNDGVCV